MQPGDHVIHKLDDKVMLVSDVNDNDITCDFKDGDEIKSKIFKKSSLEKFTPREPLTEEEQLALIKYLV